MPQAASKRKLAYSPRTNSSYFTLPAARAAQLEVLQDAVTLLLHAQDLVARIEAVCGADGSNGTRRASPRFVFQALKALPDVKAVRRQQVSQLLAWAEAVDGAKDANPLTRSRLRTLRRRRRRPPPFEPSRGPPAVLQEEGGVQGAGAVQPVKIRCREKKEAWRSRCSKELDAEVEPVDRATASPRYQSSPPLRALPRLLVRFCLGRPRSRRCITTCEGCIRCAEKKEKTISVESSRSPPRPAAPAHSSFRWSWIRR